MGKIVATQVKTLGEGRHADGGGLYLHVKPNGWRGWKFITRAGGKRREQGLGPFPKVSLADARRAAAKLRLAIDEGEDPFAKAEARVVPTFAEAASQFISSMEASWRNAKHRAQWRSTLASYCEPMSNRLVSNIDTDDVLACLTPIWQTKPETASRLRGRIERVLDYAKARGWRTGQNPALWRGHLSAILPPAAKLRRGHHGAMGYRDVPGFVTNLGTRKGIAARALEFTILTAARSGEVRGANWDEIDAANAIWIIPKERMKRGREHRVPLAKPALNILEELRRLAVKSDDLIFPGAKPGRPLSDMTLAAVLRRMGHQDVTVHGFRSSFSTWTAEMTDTPSEVREAALAHVSGDKVASAYQRGDFLNRRRELMSLWAEFITPLD